ncbi:toll/interleukin-1 receptor domain-containing protein [Sorangium sp. So ce429]
MPDPVRVFFSYSHKDEYLRDELEAHLAVLKHQGVISGWHDRRISPGASWSEEINANLEASQILLMLVSADFLASEYCYKVEMLQALRKHDAGEARAIPVIVRPVDWSGSPLSELQALPKDAKPVTSWSNRDDAWVDVCKKIRSVCEELQRSGPDEQAPEPPAPSPPRSTTPLEKEPLRALLERFLRSWSVWYFNASRISNWGSRQQSFERLKEFSVGQIDEELRRMNSAGLTKTRLSSRGALLYKLRS